MIARMIFHDKMPPQDMDNLGTIQQTCKERLSKRQQIQKAQEWQKDMLSWSKIRWNHFYEKLKGRPSKTNIVSRAANISQQIAQ
jgi:hypothetical protein